jgi:hypothetical protein
MLVTRVGPLSCAKVAGLMYLVVGLVVGCLVSLAALFAPAGEAGSFGVLFGVGAVLLFPILYGGGGFLMTLTIAWLFNVVAGITGGIDIEMR